MLRFPKMNLYPKICYLQSLDKVKKIYVTGKETIILGRNELTAIQDPHLSRKHLECKADFSSDKLVIKTIGKCYSGCNGYALLMNETYTLEHNDVLELRLGYHKFKVIFENTEEENQEPPEKKPKYAVFNVSKSKIKTSPGGMKGNWESIDNNELLIFTPTNCNSEPLIASFDIDGTIIKTKSGARFPINKDDWEWNLSIVPNTLKKYYENNYKIVFFTNQSGLAGSSEKIRDFKVKIENIISALNLPIQVFISLGKGKYRKPLVGMWAVLAEMKNDDKEIDMSKAFFVGDAAGREKDWAPKKKKDHSNADRLFALNVAIEFFTPEEFFLKSSKNPFKMPIFDPRNIPIEQYPKLSCDEQNIILMVGCQGSGKSHFCKSELVPQGYVYINRDTLKSWEKCALMLEESIKKKKNAVIDNTNPDKLTRKKYIDIVKKYNIQCRCFLMSTSFENCKHNNKYRGLTDKNHQIINDMLLYSYRKKFEPPELSEGFSEIVNVPFIPNFSSEENEKLYRMFLLES